MAVFLLILKCIGVVLLVLLALLLFLLLTPMGIVWDWKPDALTLRLAVGPLSFALWPRRTKSKPKPSEPKPPKGEQQPLTAAVQGQAGAEAAPQAQKAPPPPERSGTQPPAPKAPQEGSKAQPSAETVPLPDFLCRRLDAAVAFAKKDPAAFAKDMLEHCGWFTRRLLKSLRIRHLRVWWSVTAEEAGQTALLFAGLMTLINNLLTYLRQFLTIEADSLWLEPDFAGQQRARRAVSGRLIACPGAVLLLGVRFAWRLWHDPKF